MFAADQDAQTRFDPEQENKLAVHTSAEQQMWSSLIRE
jgi:hypothetical protein